MGFIFICLGLGLVAGLAAGLLGVGGGLLIVPVLALLLPARGVADAAVMPLALGSSLATIAFTSLSSMRAHHRRGAVDWPRAWRLSTGILAGAWAGGFLAHAAGGGLLARLFGLFELAVATHMLVGRAASTRGRVPARAADLAAGAVIGLLSALLGIGGGTLTVPWLVWHGMPVRRAVGSAAACGLPIALAGSVGYLVAGWRVTGLPAGSTGYLYWPAIVSVSAASVLAARWGAALAHRLSQQYLKRFFALLLAGLGLVMLVG
ncbi:MAG TPA: sulfite exporter TauE/SafE family protein [Gammaproteobacteria bacterium]|nr:sulfite exporter TauE/SafE family protein [Gammaproteobacteria bacterium]